MREKTKKMESKMKNPMHSFRDLNHVLQLENDLQTKSKTVMSWSSRKRKECAFCNVYCIQRIFCYHLWFISIYSVLN